MQRVGKELPSLSGQLGWGNPKKLAAGLIEIDIALLANLENIDRGGGGASNLFEEMLGFPQGRLSLSAFGNIGANPHQADDMALSIFNGICPQGH